LLFVNHNNLQKKIIKDYIFHTFDELYGKIKKGISSCIKKYKRRENDIFPNIIKNLSEKSIYIIIVSLSNASNSMLITIRHYIILLNLRNEFSAMNQILFQVL
jgi:hypothetical protein